MSPVLESPLFDAFANASENVYLFVCNRDNNESKWSKNAVDYFDMPGIYMKDVEKIWIDKIHPDDREEYNQSIKDLFSGKVQDHSVQYRALNKYGDYVWIECKGYIFDHDNIPYFAGLMTRISASNKYDELTNLLNVGELYQLDLDEGTLLLAGLDNFRKIVNNYGYSFSNRIIVEFAEKLSQLCTKQQTLIRFDGDEFLIVSPHYNIKQTKELFKQIKEIAANLGEKENTRINLSVSAGGLHYPTDGQSKDELISNLEHSLENAKELRRGDVVFFSKDIASYHKRRLTLRDELKKSIDNNYEGFELFYQPIVYAKGTLLFGCEALLRWKGETIKDSYPGEFIKELEDTGMIKDVGLWIIDEALKQKVQWNKLYPKFHININVSYRQLLDDSIIDCLKEKVKEYQLDPSLIIIELTESCKVEDMGRVSYVFKVLRDYGFKVALDDFGMAYASLVLLRKLDVDYIKIDHSFVSELTNVDKKDLIIIEHMVHLCKKLSIDTVIEGIETKEIADLVQGVDATLFQGYLYSRPVNKTQFEEKLKEL